MNYYIPSRLVNLKARVSQYLHKYYDSEFPELVNEFDMTDISGPLLNSRDPALVKGMLETILIKIHLEPDITTKSHMLASMIDAINSPYSLPGDIEYAPETELNQNMRERLEMEKKLHRTFENMQGNEKCRKCGMKSMVTESKQLRSGDEGQTSVHTCLSCGETYHSS